MRIIHSSALPAVVRIKGRGVCAVAIPDGLPEHKVLELASLVLSNTEYQEFVLAERGVVADDADRAAD